MASSSSGAAFARSAASNARAAGGTIEEEIEKRLAAARQEITNSKRGVFSATQVVHPDASQPQRMPPPRPQHPQMMPYAPGPSPHWGAPWGTPPGAPMGPMQFITAEGGMTYAMPVAWGGMQHHHHHHHQSTAAAAAMGGVMPPYHGPPMLAYPSPYAYDHPYSYPPDPAGLEESFPSSSSNIGFFASSSNAGAGSRMPHHWEDDSATQIPVSSSSSASRRVTEETEATGVRKKAKQSSPPKNSKDEEDQSSEDAVSMSAEEVVQIRGASLELRDLPDQLREQVLKLEGMIIARSAMAREAESFVVKAQESQQQPDEEGVAYNEAYVPDDYDQVRFEVDRVEESEKNNDDTGAVSTSAVRRGESQKVINPTRSNEEEEEEEMPIPKGSKKRRQKQADDYVEEGDMIVIEDDEVTMDSDIEKDAVVPRATTARTKAVAEKREQQKEQQQQPTARENRVSTKPQKQQRKNGKQGLKDEGDFGTYKPGLARRNLASSSSALSSVTAIANNKITEEMIERAVRGIGCAVHMIERVLWPEYGTLQRPLPAISREAASSYWNAIELVLKEQGEVRLLDRLRETMNGVAEGKMSHSDLMFELAWVLAGHDRLILGFDLFLPDELSMTNLLIFQKLVVCLSVHMECSIASDKKRHRLLIRQGMDDLVDALFDNGSPASLLSKSEWEPELHPHPAAKQLASKETAAFLAGSWIDHLVRKYGKTASGSKLCEQVCKAIMELGRADLTRAEGTELLGFIQEAVKNDGELKDSFESFASYLYPSLASRA